MPRPMAAHAAASSRVRNLALTDAQGRWLASSVQGWRLAGQASRHWRLERAAAHALSGHRLLADNATDLIVRLDGAMRRTYVSPRRAG